MSTPISISPRAAADLRHLLEQSQRINDRLNIYVEAIGAALEVAPGWRFDVQNMAFMPPASEASEQPAAGEPADQPPARETRHDRITQRTDYRPAQPGLRAAAGGRQRQPGGGHAE